MIIDDQTRAKLDKYLEKNNKTLLSDSGDKDNIADILEWMSKDIQKKTMEHNITDSGKAKIQSHDFYVSIYRQILGSTLSLIMDGKNLSDEELEVLQNSGELDELVIKLIMLSIQNETVADKIVKSMATSYISKCLELAIKPDEYIAAMAIQ